MEEKEEGAKSQRREREIQIKRRRRGFDELVKRVRSTLALFVDR